MNPRVVVNSMLAEAGAFLKRKRKHEVWQLPNGKTFVRATTPGDVKADANNLSDLRHALGTVGTHKEGERREKRQKNGIERPKRIHAAPMNTAFADQLRASGVAEEALRDQLKEAEESRDAAMRFAALVIVECSQCWGCRLRKWWRDRK